MSGVLDDKLIKISYLVEDYSDDCIGFIAEGIANESYEEQMVEYEKYLKDKKLVDALAVLEESGKFTIEAKK